MATWYQSRQTKYTAYAGVYIIVILAILVAVNFLANRYDKAYDSTKNKQYSLSEQTMKVVKNLKQDVKFKYFGDTPSFTAAKDLLDRYSALSPELHVEYVDPEKKPALAKAAAVRRDTPVVIEAGTRREYAKSLTEEEVTGALIRALKSGERNVCFLTGSGEKSIDDETTGTGFALVKKLLERDNYKVRAEAMKPAGAGASKPMTIGAAVPLSGVEVPKDCTVVVAGGAETTYPQPVVNALKAYVENGGHLLIMLDNVLKIGRSDPPSDQPELSAVLAGWGVTPNKDLVLDLSGIGEVLGIGPEVAIVRDYETHAIVAPIRGATAFPLVRSLDIKNADKTSVTKLLATGEASIAVTSIGPGGQVDAKNGKKGPLTIAAVGTFNGTPAGRFAVFGASTWAGNSFAGSRQFSNRDLFVNTVNWLSSDEDLISIRPKTPDDQPLNVTPQRLNSLFWISIVIFPLGIVGFGLATWWKRR